MGVDMQVWQMQDAQARFYEVIKCAETLGPQNITMQGRPVAVVISQAMYKKLTCNQQSLASFMRASPLYGTKDVLLKRDKSFTRKFSL
jgi:prevent-host-death family protein